MSADQIIDELCFHKDGLLFDEMTELFKSLFKDSQTYLKITKEIAKHMYGISKTELAVKLKYHQSGRFNERLQELEDAGFIMSFLPYQHAAKGVYYRVIDEYVNFYLNWIAPKQRVVKQFASATGYWLDIVKQGKYHAWRGLTFELICYKHLEKIMQALKLRKTSLPYTWRYVPRAGSKGEGAQIDLLFDRPDDAITLCEIRYTDKPLVIDKVMAKSLLAKKEIFVTRAHTKKQIFMALISVEGVKPSLYSEVVDQVVVLEDLF